MRIIENITLYKCEFCKKNYLKKHFCEKHEASCFHNPTNKRPCFSCEHLTKKKVQTLDFDYTNKSVFFCNKKEIYIYPPKNDIKKNVAELQGFENNPMPTDCGDYKVNYDVFE